jgi:hypothetical protein
MLRKSLNSNTKEAQRPGKSPCQEGHRGTRPLIFTSSAGFDQPRAARAPRIAPLRVGATKVAVRVVGRVAQALLQVLDRVLDRWAKAPSQLLGVVLRVYDRAAQAPSQVSNWAQTAIIRSLVPLRYQVLADSVTIRTKTMRASNSLEFCWVVDEIRYSRHRCLPSDTPTSTSPTPPTSVRDTFPSCRKRPVEPGSMGAAFFALSAG